MAEPVRIAVAGCGFQGSYHAANVVENPRTDLVVVCDVDPCRARVLGERYGTRTTTDFQAVLADSSVDAVVIATTTQAHRDMAIAAAGHGKHILLEKPMALTVDHCVAVERAVATAGVTLMIGYKFRFMRTALAAKDAVPNPIVLSAHTLYDFTQGTSSWVNDRSLSGGRLMSSLVHSVDLLRFLAGAEVVRVTAAGGNLVIDGLGEPDNAVVTMSFDNGAIASLVHGTAGASPLLSVWSFQSAGRGVNATIHSHGRRLLLHDAAREADPVEIVDPTEDEFAAGTPELLDAFVDAIAVGGAISAGPRDGTMAVLICRAIEEAISTGNPQQIPSPDQVG